MRETPNISVLELANRFVQLGEQRRELNKNIFDLVQLIQRGTGGTSERFRLSIQLNDLLEQRNRLNIEIEKSQSELRSRSRIVNITRIENPEERN